MDIQAKLTHLGYAPIDDRIVATPELVASLERDFGLTLPNDYRDFLLGDFGGAWVNATVPLKDTTPMGEVGLIGSFHGFMPADRRTDDLRWLLEVLDCAPGVIPIASDCFGNHMFLMLQGPYRNAVFYNDHDHRASWADDMFTEMFENLAPSIRNYLIERKAGTLPCRLGVPKHFYLVGTSFTEMLTSCRNSDE